MATVGKVTASAVSATNENTFALVNINADFSLLKVEAPLEYQGLGAALSMRRRENAEHGPLHRTARKLGALFEQIIPSIKTLAEAYGKRVSEISTSEKLKKAVCLMTSEASLSSLRSGKLLTLGFALGICQWWAFCEPCWFRWNIYIRCSYLWA